MGSWGEAFQKESGTLGRRSRLTDASRLAPRSQKWIAYWDQQFYLLITVHDSEAVGCCNRQHDQR
jgi:hypothetical protein